MTPLARFKPVEIERNQRRLEEGREHDRLLAHRTRGVYWGKERVVVVTFNPATARKQAYRFENKLEALRAELLSMRAKVREGAPQWRDEERVRERYARACERLHLPSDYYQLHFEQQPGGCACASRRTPSAQAAASACSARASSSPTTVIAARPRSSKRTSTAGRSRTPSEPAKRPH